MGEYVFVLYGAASDACGLIWERKPTFEVFYYLFRYRHISDKMVAAMKPHKPRSKERFEAICTAYFKASLYIEPFLLGFIQSDEASPPTLKQAALTDLAGYVGAYLMGTCHDPERNPRLYNALTEEGADSPPKRRLLLLSKLPTATLLAWKDATEKGDPLSPGGRKKNLVSRTAEYMIKDGREALSKMWVGDEPLDEDNDLGAADTVPRHPELEEFVRDEGLRATLSEREHQVIAMRLRDFTVPEIAKVLRIAEGNVKKTSARARKKLEESGWDTSR